jgi:hypothetical protein
MRLMRSLQHLVVRLDNARYHGGPRAADDIFYIVVHATFGGTYKSSVTYMNRDLNDPKGPRKKTSYHYGVERNGNIDRSLDPLYESYGSGDSAWPNPIHISHGGNRSTLNPRCINVAFALEQGERPTEEQMTSMLWLVRTLMERFDVPPSDVLAHKEVSPGRKFDPDTLDMADFRRQLADIRLLAA